ncbi:MAG: xanthine dehydrogenase family protein subunit M [Anaerolineae bacterium]|nr:xanthine dehydrogenase family protein subunit M [Anaerolineales bacterium]MCQ3973878.1 xanthine dehydrogenase family protein subunit M [Anaerolineae bacterium]
MPNPTPGLPEFDYLKPASLAEASQFLAQHAGEARPFMGGTDTFVRMRDGFWKEKYLVDVKNLDGMSQLSFDPTAGLTIGASVNMNRVVASPEVREYYPVLAEAAHTVASYQLRTRATLAGNICNASPAGDTIGPCLVLNASLQVHGVDGVRREPLSAFFVGPGRTVLKPGDIVTAIVFPLPPQNYAARYIKLGRNAIGDLAIVGVTALGYPDSSTPSGYSFRLALASVAPTPFVPAQVQTILAENPITEAVIAEAAEAAMNACAPIDDVRGSARYRKFMVRNLTKRAITEVWEKISRR